VEVRQTGDLSYFSLFLPLEPSEVQRKSNGSPSDWLVRPVRRFSASRWLHRTFTGLGLDRQRNLVKSDGIHWKSDGLSAGSVGIGRVRWKSVGIRRKRGGSVKYTVIQLWAFDYWCRRRGTSNHYIPSLLLATFTSSKFVLWAVIYSFLTHPITLRMAQNK